MKFMYGRKEWNMSLDSAKRYFKIRDIRREDGEYVAVSGYGMLEVTGYGKTETAAVRSCIESKGSRVIS